MRDRTYAGGEARMMQNPRQPSGVHKRGSQKAPDAAALSSVKPDGKSGRNLLGEVVVVVRILTHDQIQLKCSLQFRWLEYIIIYIIFFTFI